MKSPVTLGDANVAEQVTPGRHNAVVCCTIAPFPLATPVPVSRMVCVPRLSVMETLPERAPVAVGVNVTLIWQLVPAAKVTGHAVTRLKSPVITRGKLIAKEAVPVFVNVLVWERLCVPVDWFPKDR